MDNHLPKLMLGRVTSASVLLGNKMLPFLCITDFPRQQHPTSDAVLRSLQLATSFALTNREALGCLSDLMGKS